MKIDIGTRVKYKREFLRSVGAIRGELPFARGIVTELTPLSTETTLAHVDWGNEDIPKRVNVKNLTPTHNQEYV